ncbi:MAG: hypothetical protein ACMXYD_00045 [Candidatus Woesearchaeota archaeon]
MNEKQLFTTALITAILGLLALLLLPEIPSTSTYATLIWSNETTGLIEYTQKKWVQTQQPINLRTPQCVQITGIHQEDRIVNALLAPQRSKQEGCT